MVKTALTALALLGTAIGVAAVVTGVLFVYMTIKVIRDADQ
jgi:hypothetical protein